MDITAYFNEQVSSKLNKQAELDLKIKESIGGVNTGVAELEANIETLKKHVPDISLLLIGDTGTNKMYSIKVSERYSYRMSIWGRWAKDGCVHHGDFSNTPYYGTIQDRYFSTVEELIKNLIGYIVRDLKTLQIVN
jgi:hypothetical protein